MPASKVYFTDFRCRIGVSQLDKLRKLLEKSEFSQIDFDGKFVAIKLHFGELGNLSFLRANYAKVVADFIKERGGKPFITDCQHALCRQPQKRAGAYGHRVLKRLFPVLHRLSCHHRRRSERFGRYRGSRRGRRILQDRPYRPGRDGRGYRDLTGTLQGP